jgi:hypothetical protein
MQLARKSNGRTMREDRGPTPYTRGGRLYLFFIGAVLDNYLR